MKRSEAQALALDLMSQHGIIALGWTFKFDRASKRFGLCSYTNKVISISGPLTDLATEHQVRMTILHEIAHVHAGARAGHGPVWRRMCLAIGGDGKRCAENVQQPPAKWIGVCPEGHEFPFYRKPKRTYACLKPHSRPMSHRETALTLRANVG
jgi:hypothetical protein